MQVGRAVLRSVCAISGRQTVVQQNGVEVLHQNWNSLIKKAQLSGLARNVGDPLAEVAQEKAGRGIENAKIIIVIIIIIITVHCCTYRSASLHSGKRKRRNDGQSLSRTPVLNISGPTNPALDKK